MKPAVLTLCLVGVSGFPSSETKIKSLALIRPKCIEYGSKGRINTALLWSPGIQQTTITY